jgi:putative oxidoreductase
MSFAEKLSPLVGRWALAWFYFAQVGHYGGDWSGTTSLMAFAGIPAAPLVLASVLILLILGALSLALGFLARHGALLLFAITVGLAVTMHNFWQIGMNPAAREAAFDLFARDIAISGALLLMVGMGPGPFSVDGHSVAKRKG